MNQKQYESKQEQVAKIQKEINTYEQRQEKIKYFKEGMGSLVRDTIEHKFLYLDKTVVFVGYGYSEGNQGLLHGVAKTRPGDKYEKELGQIIAVFRAFGLPVNQIVKLVEKEENVLKFSYGNKTYSDYGIITDLAASNSIRF
jgi:hypothetical protein